MLGFNLEADPNSNQTTTIILLQIIKNKHVFSVKNLITHYNKHYCFVSSLLKSRVLTYEISNLHKITNSWTLNSLFNWLTEKIRWRKFCGKSNNIKFIDYMSEFDASAIAIGTTLHDCPILRRILAQNKF